MSQEYPELIRDARSRAGMSQRELARKAGTSQAVISAYENAQREPGITQLQRVIAAAGFDLHLSLGEGAGSPGKDLARLPELRRIQAIQRQRERKPPAAR